MGRGGRGHGMSHIPEEMRRLPQWVGYMPLEDKGKVEKVPISPHTLWGAASNKPETWGTYEQARAMAGKRGQCRAGAAAIAGVSFAFAEGGGIVGVDFDHCLREGRLDPWVARWVERFNSYTEVSPSGQGLHIFCKGKLPGKAVKRPQAELYDRARFFTVTGRAYGPARGLEPAQAAIDALYGELSPPKQEPPQRPLLPPADRDYLAIGLEKDAKLRSLWEGDRPNGNESSDDQALMNKLAYWCNCDQNAMIGAFLRSPHAAGKDEGHQRKAARRDYMERTARHAIEGCGSTAQGDDQAHWRRPAPVDAPRAAEQKPPARLRVISAVELQAKEIPPIHFVAEGLLPQGLNLLAAPPKYGKSWMVLDLCLAVAEGRRFLRCATNQCGCLYLALEDSERRLKGRMNKLLAGKKAPEGFYYATAAHDLEHGLLEELEDFIKGRPKTGLVVVDTLQKVRGGLHGKENAYQADYREAGKLKQFADKQGVCLLLVHHLRKAADDADPFNRISGTNGLMGAADLTMVLTKAKRQDDSATLSVVGRDVESRDLVLKFDKATCHWEALGDVDAIEERRARMDYDANPIVVTIRRLLQANPNGWKGSATELIRAGVGLANASLAESGQALSRKLRPLYPLLLENDGIAHDPVPNGNAAQKHRFYYARIATEPDLAEAEQGVMAPFQ